MTGRRGERRAVERILEDERLTADLVDRAAQVLLDWGATRARATARRSQEMPRAELDARLEVLRRTMRRVRRGASEAPPEAQPERVRALLAGIGPGTGAAAGDDAMGNLPAQVRGQ